MLVKTSVADCRPATKDKDPRLPATFYSGHGVHLSIWLLARVLDPEGSGKATFPLDFAAATLNRSVSTVRRLIAGAKAKGLIHHFMTKQNSCTLYYASLERVAANSQLDELGTVAEISLEDLPYLNIIATEVMAQGLQRSSYWKSKEVVKKQKQSVEPIHPDDVLVSPPFGTLARVLGLSDNGRWMLVSEKFVPYGTSIESIAEKRGLHPRTVQRHLSNSYRLKPSPKLGRRSDLLPIQKKQIAQRLPRHEGALVRMASKFSDLDDGRYLAIDDRVFRPKNNLYYPVFTLVPCRRRRKSYKDFLCSENGRRGDVGVLVNVIDSGDGPVTPSDECLKSAVEGSVKNSE